MATLFEKGTKVRTSDTPNSGVAPRYRNRVGHVVGPSVWVNQVEVQLDGGIRVSFPPANLTLEPLTLEDKLEKAEQDLADAKHAQVKAERSINRFRDQIRERDAVKVENFPVGTSIALTIGTSRGPGKRTTAFKVSDNTWYMTHANEDGDVVMNTSYAYTDARMQTFVVDEAYKRNPKIHKP